MADKITSVGVEPALSINVDSSFGVVCLGNRGMFCTTCRHSFSCRHVSYLKGYEDLTPELKQFIDFECKTPHIKESPTVLSGKRISFDLTPSARECFKKDYSQRFNIQNGISHLIPAATPSCPHCGIQDCWSMPCIDEKTFLVTPLCCYKAEGTTFLAV